MLRGSGGHLELWRYSAPAQTGRDPGAQGANELGLRHLAIEVTDVAAALDRVVELGGAKLGAPVELSSDGAAVVYCRDPFGTILELMSPGATLSGLDDV